MTPSQECNAAQCLPPTEFSTPAAYARGRLSLSGPLPNPMVLACASLFP